MARHIHLQPHLSIDELERRYRAAKEPNERSWWQILWQLSQGHTAVQVAAVTGYSAYWIGQLAKRYNTEGPDGMHNRRHTTSHRHSPTVPPALQEELRQAVAAAAAHHEPTFRSLVGGEVTLFIGRSEQTEDLAMQRTEAQDLGKASGVRPLVDDRKAGLAPHMAYARVGLQPRLGLHMPCLLGG